MKKYIEILMFVLLGAGFVACESLQLGDEGLSKAPETSGATIDTLFATVRDADKVLAQAYYYLPYGIVSDFDSKMGNDQLEALTDHYISNKVTDSDGPNLLYYNGGLTASVGSSLRRSMAFNYGGTSDDRDYYAIRYGWLFLENADRIPNAPAAELARKKAEAKMCIAVAYADMFRFLGGVPLIDHAVTADEEMKYPRATFAETVDFIVKLCDEAAPDLPWYNANTADDGRMTRAAALGLKLRVLCFAASPTFNSNTLWRSDANEYHCYTNYDPARWQRARAAADEFMTQLINNGYYQMVQAEPDANGNITNRQYRLAYRKGYYNRGTTETIISIRKSNSSSYHDSMIKDAGNYGNGCTLDYVNKFGWADGTEFPADFDWENPSRNPFFDPDPTGAIKIPGIETRDPRLYENVAVPGDIWRDGTVGRAYDNHRYHQANCPGFLQMKYVLQQNSDRNTPVHWCLMRLPEIFLSAAEAYNEADGGPSQKAYDWVNAVRARVGLCPIPEGLSKEEFRKAVIRERDCEFGFEEVRWFDMVRWGMTEAFTTPLSALSSIGDKDSEATSFKFSVKTAFPARSWWTNWDTKWYLCPIPTVEINKDYGMTQNPGW